MESSFDFSYLLNTIENPFDRRSPPPPANLMKTMTALLDDIEDLLTTMSAPAFKPNRFCLDQVLKMKRARTSCETLIKKYRRGRTSVKIIHTGFQKARRSVAHLIQE